MSEPDYVVIVDPNEPSVNGRWFDRAAGSPFPRRGSEPTTVATYVPTPLIETRSDGAVAQVYMRKEEHDEAR